MPVFAQKRLDWLLFAWEEECLRWRLLEEEEAAIWVMLEAERDRSGEEWVGELEKRLLEVRGLMGVKPSLRGKGVGRSCRVILRGRWEGWGFSFFLEGR